MIESDADRLNGGGPIGSDELQHVLTPDRVWANHASRPPAESISPAESTADRVAAVLAAPLDFPPVVQAIVPGDRIAIVIDPSVPDLFEVLSATIQTLGTADEHSFEIIVWDEATSELLEALRGRFGALATIERHHPTEREELRYLAADAAAQPVYCSRGVVDADFVLPITAHRSLDPKDHADPTGLFPGLSDSATRHRYVDPSSPSTGVPIKMDWLLGVQVMLRVTADQHVGAAEVVAGTPQAVASFDIEKAESSQQVRSGEQKPTELVVAVLDGDWRQQTWANVARAVSAAARRVAPGGAIVLWTSLKDAPPHGLAGQIDGEGAAAEPSTLQEAGDAEDEAADGEEQEQLFPQWDPAATIAASFRGVVDEHRVLLRSELDPESVESLSLGVIADIEELRRFATQFGSVGLLPAAQFAGRSFDSQGYASANSPSSKPR